jgi:gamma-glutamylcysteine synthetase
MTTAAAWIDDLAARFAAGFPTHREFMTLGREAEHPVVHADGTAADISLLWPRLGATGDLEPKREGEMIIGLDGDKYCYSSEVGKGTIEIILSPTADLNEMAALYEEAMGRLLLACYEQGFVVLGYGIQPVQDPVASFMTPKQRYGVLLEVIGETWLWFTLTASDQTHVAVTRDQFVPLSSLGNLLAPVTVALLGNSPIFSAKDHGFCSAREGTMARIHSGEFRHGMPARAFDDVRDMTAQLAHLHHLMRKQDGRTIPATGRFEDFLRAPLDDRGQPTEDPEQVFAAYLLHEHYVWHSARARSNHGTVEFRAACQQPGRDHLAAATLHAGLAAGAPEIAALLAEKLGADAWPAMRAWHHGAIHDGLAAAEPLPGLLDAILDRAEDGLRRRGRGEERYMEPLRRRAAARENPAQRARKVFAESGIAGLIREVRWDQ